VIAYLDGDYSDPPAALPRVLAPVLTGAADMSLGSRDLRHAAGALPPHARLGNQLALLGIWALTRRRLRDLPSLKAVRAEALRALDMSEMTYGWTTELIVKAIRARLSIAETPVPYRRRLAGRSKVSGTLRGSVGAAWKLLSCAVRYAAWLPADRGTATAMPEEAPP
jgi:hypothetical protein